ncbi:hypothetical protein Tco_0097121 [Tanacetum coccineum]
MQNQINSLKGDLKNEIQNTIKSQQAVMMNQQTTFQNNLQNMICGLFQNQASTSGTLPSNTIPNPKGEMKAITTRSGVAYEKPSIPTNPSPKKVVEQETEETTDKEQMGDSKDLGKLKPIADIRIFIGYAPANKAFRIYNKRTRLITETIHVDFNELTTMASKQFSLGPGPQLLTPRTITCVASPVPIVVALEPADSTGLPSSTPFDQDAPSPSTSQTPQESQSLVISPGVVEELHDIEVAHLDNDPFFGASIPEPNSKECSPRDVIQLMSLNQSTT